MIKAGLNPPKSLDLVRYSVAVLRQRGEELRSSHDEVVSNIKKMFAGSKFEEQENGDLLIVTKNGRKILYKITDRVVLNNAETQEARKAHAIGDNVEVTVEGRYRPVYEDDIDAIIEVALDSRNNTEAHETTHAVIDLALGKEGAKPLFDRASQLAEEYGLKADSEELACNAVRDWIVARENGFITTFTADEAANLKKSLWGRVLIKANKMGAEAKVFNGKNEAELKKTTWGKMLLAKMQIQRSVAKLMRAIYDFYKKFQAVRNSNENFHNLARKIESGEVWGEKTNKGRTGNGYKYQSVLRNAPDTFLNDKQKQTYKEDGESFIKDLYDNKVSPTSYIKMTSSPLILQKLGYSADDIVMLKSKALTAMKPDGSEPHAHGLTDKMMAKTAMALHEPIFVMQSKTRPNDSIVVFTEIKDEKERSIIVPIQITKNKNGIANVATSEYGRTNEEIFIAKQLTDGRILYVNSKKGPAWAEPTRLRLPLGLLKQSLNLERSIAQDSQKSKPQYSIRQTPMGQALYQAAWHGTPAIIEGNLTTKRIGEGEGAIAHGWGLYFAKSREVSQVNYRERLTQSQGLEPTGKVSITDSETGKKYSWDIEDIDAGYDIVHQEYLSAVTDQAIRYFLEARGNLRRAIGFAEDAVASKKAFLEEWENKKPSSDEEVRKYKEAKKAEEEVAADAIRNFVSAREHGYVTDFTKSEIAKLNKTNWGRMMLRANRLGRKAALFTKLNEERLSKSAWGRLILAKVKLQRAVAKLFRKIYDGFKRWQALSKSIGSFHDLARRIELGEVWDEKNLDKITKDGGIIKKNGAKNGGVADGNDGRGQEDLRGTAGRVQGRQGSTRNNQGNSERQGARYEGIKRNVRGILTEKQNSAYEGIDPTIHADEWQEASGDLQGFSNALNEARAANKRGAFVDGKSPEELQSAKVAMTIDGLAGCAVEDDGNITAVFKNPTKKAPKAVRSIITMARAMGGTKMDCFGVRPCWHVRTPWL